RLELDLDGYAVDDIQHLVERRDPLALAGVERPQLGQRQLVDLALAIGGARRLRVVADDEYAVAGAAYVELDRVHTVGERPAKGAERVLRLDAHRAAVADEGERRR